MTEKIAILHQGFIPRYRVRFFELLNRQSDELHYVIYHGDPPSNTAHSQFRGNLRFPNVRVKNFELAFRHHTIYYQTVIASILFGSYRGVILGHELKFISNMLLFLLCKVVGKPVIWWGHGFEKQQDKYLNFPLFSKIIQRVKFWLARSADMYIVYTAHGAETLEQSGVPKEKIAIVRNTLDIEEQRALHRKFTDSNPSEFRKKSNLKTDSIILLYIGRIYKEKRVEELFQLVERINSENLCDAFVEAVIIGDGPELNNLIGKASNMEGIHFLGEIYDQEVIAQYMRVASAVIIPGKVGLAVNHAFSHGVPVITRRHNLHAPEVEYIESGKNGLIVEGDFENFVRMVVAYLNSPTMQNEMSERAIETRNSLLLDQMVRHFHHAVVTTIDGKRRRTPPLKPIA